MRISGQKIAVVSLGLVLSCCTLAFPLDPSLDINQYGHHAWTTRDGFIKGAIVAIVQTPDGYMWLGTEYGLLRFDGVKTVAWQPSRDQHLPSSQIFSVLPARDGTLWIGTGKGLASWKNGKLTQYPELAGHYVFAVVEDHEGTIWASGITVALGKLCAIRRGNVQCYGEDGTLGRGAFNLFEDSKGNLWAGVKEGLWRWRPGPPKFYPLPGEPDGIQALSEDTDGTLLVGWNEGLYRFVDGRTEAYPLASPAPRFVVKRILRDREGSLWIACANRGLIHIHQGRIDTFTQSQGLSGDPVNTLFEDREGSIWAGTISGLDRFRQFPISTLTEAQGLSSAVVDAVLADKEGGVWLSTRTGLDRFKNGQVSSYRIGALQQKTDDHPNSLFQDKHGRLWVSTPGNIGYLESNHFIRVNAWPGGAVLSMAEDRAGNLWVANDRHGLFGLSAQSKIRRIPWAELGHKDYAGVLASDPRQEGVWMGFFLGGIAYFANGQVRSSYSSADGLGEGRINGFQFDQDGTMWIATEGGLSRLKSGHIATLTSRNGLPCEAVNWVMEDDSHSFWLYMPCGLVRITRAEMDGWANSEKKAEWMVHPTVFDSSDGVRSHSIGSHFSPQVTKSRDGKLWFLPWDGVSIIDPQYMHLNNLPPPVHVEQVIADGKTYEAASGLRLPALVRNLTFDFVALSLAAPEKNRYRFKLEGWDRDWRDTANELRVEYSNLPPRHYKFRVLACNNNGVWSPEGATLEFVIPPAWYQTNWFRVACVAVFLWMIWAAHQLRVRQVAAQFNMRLEERVHERTRIAREIHDTLLQSFHGLLMRFQTVARLLPGRPAEAKEKLESAIEQAEDAILEGREAVQGLRVSTIERNDLAPAIRTLAEELAGDSSLPRSPKFRVEVQGEPQELHPILRDEIYRTAVEALRNAFRHSQAQQIEVEIEYGERLFRLRVRDDGRGFDPNIFPGQDRQGHYGLRGMRERAKIAGGKLKIWSEAGAGTEVELEIPASHAYAKAPKHSWRRAIAGTRQEPSGQG